MTIDLTTLDAYAQPTEELKGNWKRYSKTDHAEFVNHPDIDEVASSDEFKLAGCIPAETRTKSFQELQGPEWDPATLPVQDAPIYYHPLLPGLLIIPSLVPPGIQKSLLSRMIHRDLSNPTHQTNLHLHYDLPYPEAAEGEAAPPSFFSYPLDTAPNFVPKDPDVHKPLSIRQVLQRRLSWVTLGGQYDWTNREYPNLPQPDFPHDISGFLHTLFPETEAQAAIVNFYSPGDTMMMHRDVSEHTDKGLVSLSIGCDALFMITPSRSSVSASQDAAADTVPETAEETTAGNKPYLLLRLRSGDAIYMSQESRYAWHGVPKVLKGTCPDFLADWPAEDGKYDEWKGWMQNKRINLNVRQMND